MSNKLNPFEEQLKKAAESHQVPYDSAQWDALNKKLDTNTPKTNSWLSWAVAAASLVAVAIMINVYLPQNEEAQVVTVPVEEEVSNDEMKTQVTEGELIETAPKETPPMTKEVIVEENLTASNHSSTLEENSVEVSEKKLITEHRKKQEVVETDPPNELVKTTLVNLPEIVLEKNTVCAGVEAKASLSFVTDLDVVWIFGNGETAKGNEMKYSYREDGEYEVKLMFPTLGLYSESVTLTILPKPDASFSVKENLANEMVEVVELTANTGGEKSYSWTLGDGFIYNGEEVSHVYTKAKDYEISLQVLNKYGCFWTNFHRYTKQRVFNLLAPNSFTPNADGDNDEWIPVALTSGYFQFELSVLNRNGKLVFTSKSAEQKFDGRVNGKLVPSGEVFIWKASTIDPQGITQMYGGTIMVIY